MLKSENIGELTKALVIMQGQLKPVARDAVNPFFKSRYTTLDSIWGNCRPCLVANELAISQTIGTYDGKMSLETILFHSSGQYIGNSFELPCKIDNMQMLGSAITYARRYAISGLLGIVADEDDDGETHRTTQSPTKQQPKPSTATTEPEKAVQEELQKAGVESEVESVEKIPQTAVEFYNWLLTLPKGKTQNKTWFLKVTGTKEEELATPDGVRHAYDWMQEHLKGNYEKT